MTEEEKELTAYHEGGHALVGFALPNLDPIHKVTIIPERQGRWLHDGPPPAGQVLREAQ